ncbi:uncharacterized protein TRIADDRAFT_56277 [Trichoplax adhaerens]|uniref:Protein MIX23 n=1 Tax=Trichoplax adhaerens TaxID=10228 RepID=B3RXP2_TRIAD|nr:hypothetical protein TRIADDRAFT_56277 [Trichoplax adhaerens]EDV24890.1 hypothetical protein TRIADDRAFT_56277 [Trichoplax adhaerens]|eukprot:XP_002112780.1 hypothetical protein TRIADDRAFT_56277 [Trichoplax adhaerens]
MATDPAAKEKITINCHNFSQFQDALRTLRKIDDTIIYKLNNSVPTTSFEGEVDAGAQCKDLHRQLTAAYVDRENTIRSCIKTVSNRVTTLRDQRDKDPDDLDAMKELREEQWKLRQMQNELGVEEVVRNRSLKVFNERCWRVFKPENEKFSS